MKNADLDALRQARADLDAANIEMRVLDERVKMLRLAIEYLEKAAKSVPIPDPGKVPDSTAAATTVKKTKELSASAFCELIVDEEGPTEMAEFYDAMIVARYELSGKDENAQKSTLAGYLARVGVLKHYKEFGRWWYADKPYPLPEKRRSLFKD